MSQTEISDTVSGLFTATVTTDGSEKTYITSPTESVIREIITTIETIEGDPQVRLLAPEKQVKEALSTFIIETKAVEQIENGKLEIRTIDEKPNNPLVVQADSVYSLVPADEQIAALSSDDEEFVEAACGKYDTMWENAKEYKIRTPSITTIEESLEEDINSELAEDFRVVFESMETADVDVNRVALFLLLAAKNNELLYDISAWGEDSGLASKATFSRTKTRLEDLGTITTEKVPIDVGRPRLRLELDNDKLEEAEVEDFASTAAEVLGS